MFREGPHFCAKQGKKDSIGAHMRFRHAGAGLESPRAQPGAYPLIFGPHFEDILGTFRAMLHHFGPFLMFFGVRFLGAFLEGVRACSLVVFGSILGRISEKK